MNDVSSQERNYGVRTCEAGTGGVVKNTFVDIADDIATTATSGFCGIALETADAGDPVPIKVVGMALLIVNANSVNISGGDPIKPTTAGRGVKADTTKDLYSAIAQDASTTDADVIKVKLDTGVLNI